MSCRGSSFIFTSNWKSLICQYFWENFVLPCLAHKRSISFTDLRRTSQWRPCLKKRKKGFRVNCFQSLHYICKHSVFKVMKHMRVGKTAESATTAIRWNGCKAGNLFRHHCVLAGAPAGKYKTKCTFCTTSWKIVYNVDPKTMNPQSGNGSLIFGKFPMPL